MGTPLSPLISVRATDPATGEPLYGNGTGNFVTNLQAVAAIVNSTLLLLQGENFIALQAGTPLFQALVGQPIAPSAVALIYQNILLGVPYVTGISALSVVYIPQARSFAFTATVQTSFGPLVVNSPLPTGLSWSQLTPGQWASISAGQWSELLP